MERRDTLKELSLLAQSLRDAERAADEADKALKAARAEVRRLAEEDIPALMSELELAKIVLDSGEELTVKEEVYASIPKAREEEALAWLEEHDFGGLIKTALTIPFGRGEAEAACEWAEKLAVETQHDVEVSAGVHPQTLKAFLKEQLAAGAAVPLELFGARPVRVASLKAARR
jgi:hypothetical protein